MTRTRNALCTILFTVFGKDTRTAQWYNVILAILWVGIFIANIYCDVLVYLPYAVREIAGTVVVIYSLVILFALLAFRCTGRPKQMFKSFALLLGSLAQAIIANRYVTDYPPLDVALIISTGFSLLFVGAVIYIVLCEGVDGVIRSSR